MRLIVAIVALVLAGCAGHELRKEAMGVIVTRMPVPSGCRFVGMIVATEGGVFDGPYKTGEELAQGALNRLRNRAAEGGANYVLLEDSRAGFTFLPLTQPIAFLTAIGQQTDVTLTGGAYFCPATAIVLSDEMRAFTPIAIPGSDLPKKRNCVTKTNFATGKPIEVCR